MSATAQGNNCGFRYADGACANEIGDAAVVKLVRYQLGLRGGFRCTCSYDLSEVYCIRSTHI